MAKARTQRKPAPKKASSKKARPKKTNHLTQMAKAAKDKFSKAMAPELGRMFDQLQDAAGDWLAFASLQRGRLVREVRSLCEEIVEKISETPVFAHREDLVREVRQQLDTLLHRINAGALIDKAIDSAKMKQHDILSFLNVPSQEELKSLQRKLNQIEARLNTLRTPRREGSSRSTSTN